ncbi:OmpA family protein [Seonamhaeicola sp.]|uniref:OmpA family protein n=1 Tax=Seonamhaeicola sp. TaxID=1912245 RepID=UPI0026342D37|nr:OmpA family protein [Seonamhaeicola sp.]
MKAKLLVILCLATNMVIAQTAIVANSPAKNNVLFNSNTGTETSVNIDANGFNFEVLDAGANTKYSEFASGLFRNKLITVSSKKIGGLAKIDPNTNEAYKELFCLDVSKTGQLSAPLLFSRILNTNDSEDQLTFSPDQKTVYYTRSSKENSLEFKLYRATLETDSHGNWLENELLSINKEGISIETPYLNKNGTLLYFSSNMEGSIGGYDIFVSKVSEDGTLDTPVNLGHSINTTSDEKYPSLSVDGKRLFFSSNGHSGLGGHDLFMSKILKNNKYKAPRNLGNTINTAYDELAFFFVTETKGYLSSNRPGGKGGYDIYTAVNNGIAQSLEGQVLDLETKIKLPNALVVLTDEDNNVVGKQMTNENGVFKFENINPFETYTVTTEKDGFVNGAFKFLANKGYDTTYKETFELNTTEPVIAKVEDEMHIVLENIYFDYAKYTIKEESTISLNKIVKVLREHPKMKIAINAHTDIRGNNTYNLKLSDKRAWSALNYLENLGIDKNRLISKGYGETKPLIDCKSKKCSEDDHQTNRRVEFVILE